MTTQQGAVRGMKLMLIVSVLGLGLLGPGPAMAGGLILYEVGTAEFSNLGQLSTTLQNAGLLNANIDVGRKVPQQAMGSIFAQVNDRWAVLGSIGWQQWSKFGQVDLGITDTANPTSLTKNLDFKDTWHFAAGAQYKLSDPWLLNFGVAYDTGLQGGSTASQLLPVDSA